MLFTNEDLKKLIIPLIIEQFLAIAVGFADTLMVSNVGEAAVSAVSLVDQINILIIQVFSALGTGGAVLTSQYLGRKAYDGARNSAKQLLLVVAVASCSFMLVALLFNRLILQLIYGQVEEAVMLNARIYFRLSAMSYPFIGLYNAGAALFRAIGNSKVSMVNSFIMNVINCCLNAVFIFGCKWGVFGAALATLIARATACVVTLKQLASHRNGDFYVDDYRSFNFDRSNISKILIVGIPSGLENGMFQLGKLLVARLNTFFGTASIAANAVCNNVFQMQYMAPMAVGLAMLTVVSRCMGAGDFEQAKHYSMKLLRVAYYVLWIATAIIFAILPLILPLYNLSAETVALARRCIIYHLIVTSFLWPIGFPFANVFRAAADARFVMIVSVASMMIFRVGGSYVIGKYLGYGLMGVFTAMFIDWVCRIIFFVWRYRSGKWLKKKLV